MTIFFQTGDEIDQTDNRLFRIPTGFRPKAQGCPALAGLPWVGCKIILNLNEVVPVW